MKSQSLASDLEVFHDDFSQGLGAWTQSGGGTWNVESLQGSASYPASGSGAPAAHSDNCDAGCTLALAFPLDLSGAAGGRLELSRYVATTLDAGEYLAVDLWDGSTWVTVREWSGGAGDDGQWHSEVISLDPYMGRVDFALRFRTQQSYFNEHVMVDDVRVLVNVDSASCGDAICDAAEACDTCPGDCGPCAGACGDGLCGPEEGCDTCALDCGECGPAGQDLFFDAFDSGLDPLWEQSGEGDWNVEALASNASYPASGSGAPAAHSDNCDSGCALTSTPIDLSGVSGAKLTFLRYVGTSLDAGEYLRLSLWDGRTWTTLRDWTEASGDDGRWHQEQITLSAFEGVTDFRIRFQTLQSSAFEHVHVDDVRVFVGDGDSDDSDADGLPDAVETNTGTYRGPNDTGTDPNLADTDGDGLADGAEVLGTAEGLDLPAMGVSPVHRDLLIELDWFDDASCGAFHSHRALPVQIDMVKRAFANAPLVNPDGTMGIHFIADYGQGGVFTGGNLISDDDGVLQGTEDGIEFQGHKAAHLAARRHGYFHYTIMAHAYSAQGYHPNSSGVANLPGDDLIVASHCWLDRDLDVAGTLMHELGHNLGLFHGGDENVNHKPNYNSVMNYNYQFRGVDSDCDGRGDGTLDYSRDENPALDETRLDEAAGICGGYAQDWDWDGSIDRFTVMADINRSNYGNGDGDGAHSLLEDHDDWASVHLDLTTIAELTDPDQPIVACPGPPDARE